MESLREMHLRYRAEDQRTKTERRFVLEARQLGHPDAAPGCTKAIRHDANAAGACRWCGKTGIKAPKGVPDHPWELDGGVLQVDEMYLYHLGDDEADLPGWWVRSVHEAA